MSNIVVAAIWAAAVVWGWREGLAAWQADRASERALRAAQGHAARRLRWRMARLQRPADQPAPAPKPDKVPLPVDLLNLANQESAPWARDQMADAFRDTYAETGDWDAVRQAVGIGMAVTA